MNAEIINGQDFIDLGIKTICKINDIEYQENCMLINLKYDVDTNENYQYELIRTITHDGSFYFTNQKLYEIFCEFIKMETYYKPSIADPSKVKKINYTIGDVRVENTYGVKSNKKFPMMEQRFIIPVNTKIVFKS